MKKNHRKFVFGFVALLGIVIATNTGTSLVNAATNQMVPYGQSGGYTTPSDIWETTGTGDPIGGWGGVLNQV